MLFRVLLLMMFLLLKVLGGFVACLEYKNNQMLRVTGKAVIDYQNISKCNFSVGRFYGSFDHLCEFSQNQEIRLIGRYQRRMIDMIYGKLWLSGAEIDKRTEYRSEAVIGMSVGELFGDFRENISNIFYKYLPAEEAGLVAGIVLGNKDGIGDDLYKKMVNSGTIHIAVASGYNLMLVGGSTLSVLFWFMRRKQASVVAILITGIYALLAGGEPPVVRAFIMSSLVFVGQSLGRSQTSWWALLLAAWLMPFFDITLIGSVSFQLSVAASIGLMIVEPAIRRYFDTLNSKVIQLLCNLGLLTTISTLLLTAPIIWFHFGRFNLMGIISNTLVLPMVPPLMLLGGLMIVFGGLMSLPVYILSHLMIMIINFTGR